MTKALTTKDLEYRTMIMAFLSSQLWLEIQDEVQGTALYRHSLKNKMKQVEKEIEKFLGPEFADLYNRDEESFRVYMQCLEELMAWVSTAKFEDVIDLTKALNTGQLKFEE